MKKLTCKPASETPGASSPSGTSAKMVATAKEATPAVAQSKFGYIVRKAQKRTPEQALKALIRAGIVTPQNELADHYKSKSKAATRPKVVAKVNAKPKAATAQTKAAASKAAKKIEA